MRLPKHIKINVQAAEAKGHKLVSQGCNLFRCTGCNQTGYMDIPYQLNMECAARFVCPHCGEHKQPYNVTCTRSQCQELEALANAERNRKRRKVTS